MGGSRSSFPSLCISPLEGQPRGTARMGSRSWGAGCDPEGISNHFQLAGENVSQQMNTPRGMHRQNILLSVRVWIPMPVSKSLLLFLFLILPSFIMSLSLLICRHLGFVPFFYMNIDRNRIGNLFPMDDGEESMSLPHPGPWEASGCLVPAPPVPRPSSRLAEGYLLGEGKKINPAGMLMPAEWDVQPRERKESAALVLGSGRNESINLQKWGLQSWWMALSEY